MAKTIRDTILAYPGLADCEDFLDNVVLPGRGFEGTEDSKTIDIQKQWQRFCFLCCRPVFNGRWSTGLHRKQTLYHLSSFLV